MPFPIDFRKEENRMTAVTNPDLVQFRDFLNGKIASGQSHLTPEEALDEYLSIQYTPAEREECIAAVRESLAEIESGAPGRLASEYLAEVRARYGLNK
jgi:hypothetical protein